MNKDEIKTDKIKKGLKRFSAVGSEISCSDCPYRYRFNDLSEEAFAIITEQEKEIQQLTRECNEQAETLAKEQKACVECELEQSWKLFARDKEIDRLRAENERFENNMKSVLEIEKKNAVKEFAEKLKARITNFTGRHDLSVHFFNDIVSDLLKRYEK